jgi:hypothetical protein
MIYEVSLWAGSKYSQQLLKIPPVESQYELQYFKIKRVETQPVTNKITSVVPWRETA